MKKVFSHENRMIVFNMKNLLQAARLLADRDVGHDFHRPRLDLVG